MYIIVNEVMIARYALMECVLPLSTRRDAGACCPNVSYVFRRNAIVSTLGMRDGQRGWEAQPDRWVMLMQD